MISDYLCEETERLRDGDIFIQTMCLNLVIILYHVKDDVLWNAGLYGDASWRHIQVSLSMPPWPMTRAERFGEREECSVDEWTNKRSNNRMYNGVAHYWNEYMKMTEIYMFNKTLSIFILMIGYHSGAIKY